MEEYQLRVIGEKRENDERLEKLVAFIGDGQTGVFPSLPLAEQERLRLQAKVMRDLSVILELRIVGFQTPRKAASRHDVPRPTNDQLIELSYELCLAIEACGASPELTRASALASDLHIYLRKPE